MRCAFPPYSLLPLRELGFRSFCCAGMVNLSLIGHRTGIAVLLAVTTCFLPSASTIAATRGPAAGPTSAAPPPAADPAVDEETARLREAMQQELPRLISDMPQREQAWVEQTHATLAAAGYKIERPQVLVVVDRNPRVQQMRVLLARSDGPWQSLGGTTVSTGRPGGFEHFLTPTGVFPHTTAILDWRAEGTFNEHNVRGLGLAGMRVWDFGWQSAVRGWGPPGRVSKMRFLVHATDPANLERRIGRPASDGCVRIPTAMNRFLDAHGVLDRDYELAAQKNRRIADVLLPDRRPTPLAGNTLVVIDSSGNADAPAVASASPNQTGTTGSSHEAVAAPTIARNSHHLTRSHHRHARAAIAARRGRASGRSSG
jgi:hypothetical protein